MPNPSPEMGGYQRPEASSGSPDRPQPTVPAEAQPHSREKLEAQHHAPADPIVVPAVAAQPFLPTPSSATNTAVPTVQPQPGNPLVANDDDLIEKEWVDKAKKIVQQTRSDPYTQEKEVSKLQADYIKKRYGKDVKLPNE